MKQTSIQKQRSSASVLVKPSGPAYNPERLLSFVDLVALNDALQATGWDARAYVQMLTDMAQNDPDSKVRIMAADRLRAHSLEALRLGGLIRDIHSERQHTESDDSCLDPESTRAVEVQSETRLRQIEALTQETIHVNPDTSSPPTDFSDRSYAELGHRPPGSRTGRGLCASQPAPDEGPVPAAAGQKPKPLHG